MRSLHIAGLAAGALAVLFAIVASQAAWAEAEESDGTTTYHAFAVAVNGVASSQFFVKWSDPLLESQGGVDALRVGGPLLVAGAAFVGLGALANEHALWFRVKGAGGAAALAHSIGSGLVLVAVVLLPIGMADNNAWGIAAGITEAGTELQWGAGLVVGILAGVAALAAAVTSIIALFVPADPPKHG